ncbi:hypothetical protein A8B75_15650 [Sphingomonadales bacterium EhC05]|nr:hypothetical protein A8B75_15650 [Sphingomonadales bacterium EhC05]
MRFLLNLLLVIVLHAPPAIAETITEQELRAHIAVLASDEFEGRKPGTEGENKTVNYIATQWSQAGLVPGTGNQSWYAPVTLVERFPSAFNAAFAVTSDKQQRRQVIPASDIILRAKREREDILDIPVIFAGYANEKPEELRRLVSGKLALLHMRKPKGRNDLPDYITRKKQLITAGAAAVLSVVEGNVRWSRSTRFFQRSGTTLEGDQYHGNIEGLIRGDRIRKMLKKAGLHEDQFGIWQGDPDFRAMDVPVRIDLSAQTHIRKYASHNVVGKIPGSDPQSGVILFMGHWDHFGECRIADPLNPSKDRICNGAVDNASGISLMIEVSRRLAKANLSRDIYFLATTAEEMGLLGAYAFVDDAPFPLDSLIAVFNADTVALAEDGRKIAVIGMGKAGLDDEIEKVAKQENRELDRSGKSEVFIQRQDGYAFLEKGIPAYMITSAFADEVRLKAFIDGSYHDVGDELNESLLLGGAVDDANFHVALGHYFGSTATYPEKGSSDIGAN